MARFYSNENIALQVVTELRGLGHDVLTSLDAGKANAALPDAEVLAFAVEEGRILLSSNRRHFLELHRHRAATMLGSLFAHSTRISAHKPRDSTRQLRPSPI